MTPNPYGFCPECGAPSVARQRRINGYDACANGHEYPSVKAVQQAPPVGALSTLVPLSEIADPEAFLKGARVPLRTNTENRIEVVGDAAIIVLANGICGLQALNDLHGVGWSLDCSDPDVARWVDRKIAGRLARCKFVWGVLALDGGMFEAFWGTSHVVGQCGLDHLIGPEVLRDEAHIPAARATLLRHLFGVQK